VFNDNGHFFLALIEFFLFFAWIMVLFWVFGDIFRSKDLGGLAKTLWVLFIIFTFWLGLLVYLLVRGRGMQERAMEAQKEMAAHQAEYIKSVAGAGASPTDQIANAKSLLDSGAISQQEFDALKAKALA
jgi:type VI protein secretion system component VasK